MGHDGIVIENTLFATGPPGSTHSLGASVLEASQ